MNSTNTHYAGFGLRLIAYIIDSIILGIIIYSVFMLVIFITGQQHLLAQVSNSNPHSLAAINQLMPILNIIMIVLGILFFLGFWFKSSATPGKSLLGMSIVDEESQMKPKKMQFVIRYIGYIVSTIPLCLGFIWVIFDPKKQAWHDKLSKTMVVLGD